MIFFMIRVRTDSHIYNLVQYYDSREIRELYIYNKREFFS